MSPTTISSKADSREQVSYSGVSQGPSANQLSNSSDFVTRSQERSKTRSAEDFEGPEVPGGLEKPRPEGPVDSGDPKDLGGSEVPEGSKGPKG